MRTDPPLAHPSHLGRTNPPFRPENPVILSWFVSSASPVLPQPPPGSWGSQCSPTHPHPDSKRSLQAQPQHLLSPGSLGWSQRCQDQRGVSFSAFVPPGSACGKADPGAASRRAWLFSLRGVRMKQPLARICCQSKAGFTHGKSCATVKQILAFPGTRGVPNLIIL